MSRTYSADPIADAPDLEAALATLRSHGMRASAARRIVLEALFLAGEPVTAERIAGGLDGRLPASDPGVGVPQPRDARGDRARPPRPPRPRRRAATR